MMRKFVIYVLFIAGSSWALSSVIAWSFETLFLAKTESQVNYKLSRFYDFNDDVLFLGSSRAEQSFMVDTIFKGDHAYNYGLVGTGNWLWPKLLEDAVANDKPELILINVDPDSLDHGTEWNMSYYLDVPHHSTVFSALKFTTRRRIRFFPFKYFGQYIELFRTGIKQWKNSTSYDNKGTNISIKPPNPASFFNQDMAKDSVLLCKEDDLQILSEILLKNSQDMVVFIKLPSYQEKGYKIFFNQLEHRLEGVAFTYFLDYTGELSNKSNWNDHLHLNLDGATKFSKMLRRDLQLAADSSLIEIPPSVQFQLSN